MLKSKPVITSFILSLLALAVPLLVIPSQQVVLIPDPDATSSVDRAELDEAKQVIDHRLAEMNLWGWPRTTIKDQRIVIGGLYLANRGEIIRTLGQTGRLELIDTGVDFPHVDGLQKVETGPTAMPDQNVYQTLLSNADFLRADLLPPDETHQRADFGVAIDLEPQAAADLAEFLTYNRGVYICLTLDSTILGCPIVRLEGTRLHLYQGPTDILLRDASLVGQINSGLLPLPLTVAGGDRPVHK